MQDLPISFCTGMITIPNLSTSLAPMTTTFTTTIIYFPCRLHIFLLHDCHVVVVRANPLKTRSTSSSPIIGITDSGLRSQAVQECAPGNHGPGHHNSPTVRGRQSPDPPHLAT